MEVFLIQRFTAIGLVVFLALHMIIVHYPPGNLDFTRVLVRLENPLWKVIDIVFLLTVLAHALAGSYAFLHDFQRLSHFSRVISIFLITIGIIGFIYGSWTILSFLP